MFGTSRRTPDVSGGGWLGGVVALLIRLRRDTRQMIPAMWQKLATHTRVCGGIGEAVTYLLGTEGLTVAGDRWCLGAEMSPGEGPRFGPRSRLVRGPASCPRRGDWLGGAMSPFSFRSTFVSRCGRQNCLQCGMTSRENLTPPDPFPPDIAQPPKPPFFSKIAGPRSKNEIHHARVSRGRLPVASFRTQRRASKMAKNFFGRRQAAAELEGVRAGSGRTGGGVPSRDLGVRRPLLGVLPLQLRAKVCAPSAAGAVDEAAGALVKILRFQAGGGADDLVAGADDGGQCGMTSRRGISLHLVHSPPTEPNPPNRHSFPPSSKLPDGS